MQDTAPVSDGTVELVFAPEGRGTEPLTEADLASVRWVIENERSISEALIASLFREYPALQRRYTDQVNLLPHIRSADEFRRLIGLHAIYIHQVQKDGVPYVGFEFGCTWDHEHGLGVLMHGRRVVEIGWADTAFLLWIAEEDRDLPAISE